MVSPTMSGGHKPGTHNTGDLLQSSDTWSASTTRGTGSYQSVKTGVLHSSGSYSSSLAKSSSDLVSWTQNTEAWLRQPLHRPYSGQAARFQEFHSEKIPGVVSRWGGEIKRVIDVAQNAFEESRRCLGSSILLWPNASSFP